MKKVLLSLMSVIILSLSVIGSGFAADQITDPAVRKDLATARRATAKYHDVDIALADGYLPLSDCVSVPGVGTMGIHYINLALVMDPSINLSSPEALLYVPTDDGLRLVGIEYFMGIGAPGGPIPPTPPPAPELFDRPFDGPMEGHDPQMPPHYDLHVWVWQTNPEGMFTQFNPNVTCQ